MSADPEDLGADDEEHYGEQAAQQTLRQAQCHAGTFEAFADANPDVLAWKPSILDRYYSRELLISDVARKTFLMPDRVVS